MQAKEIVVPSTILSSKNVFLPGLFYMACSCNLNHRSPHSDQPSGMALCMV